MDSRALELVAPDEPDVERIWRALEEQAHPAYFQSWGWIASWLGALPPDQRPALAVLHDGREVSGAFFLAQRRVRRSLVLQSHALYFNVTGSTKHDEIGLAHNGLLAVPGARRSLAHVLDQLGAAWDEMHLPAIDPTSFDDLASPALARYSVRVDREELIAVHDLRAARADDALLDRVDVHVATSCTEALAIYDELLHLQVRDAAGRRRRYALTESWTERFQRHLITERFAHGEIQLLRITRAGTPIACVFNLVYGGRVHAHRGAVATFLGDGLDCARIAHAAVVAFNAAAGHATYESIDDTHATAKTRLAWLTVERGPARAADTKARRWLDVLLGDGGPLPQVA